MYSRFKILLLINSLFVLLSGCANEPEETVVTISDITAEEVMELDSEADIFQYNSVVYQTNIEWVDKLDLTPGEKVMEIEEQSFDPADFSDGYATDLSIGTEIFRARERQDILIAEVDGEYIYYLAIVEG